MFSFFLDFQRLSAWSKLPEMLPFEFLQVVFQAVRWFHHSEYVIRRWSVRSDSPEMLPFELLQVVFQAVKWFHLSEYVIRS